MYSNADRPEWSGGDLRGGSVIDGLEDETVRGIRLNSSSFDRSWAGAGNASMRLQGDFYNEPDNVRRGVTMGDQGMLDMFGAGDIWSSPFGFKAHGGPSADCPQALADEGAPQFSDDQEPAEVPAGGCSCTSVILKGNVSAAQAARSVYNFLNTKVRGSIFKVNPAKFSIKADVFHESAFCPMHCTMKVRVFKTEKQQLSVEFRRCRGDSVAFGHIFDQAVRHLQLDLEPCASAIAPALARMPPAPPASAAGTDCNDLQPLVHMVANTSNPALQAEAVAALAAIAGASAAGAAAIWALLGGMQEVLIGLCSTGRLDEEYPAALLASRLAQHEGNAMANEFVMAALQGAVAENTSSLVRLELAEAVRAVAMHCAAPASECTSRDTLRLAIAEALLDKPVDGNQIVTKRLREALCMLEGPGLLGLPSDGVMA